MGIYDRDQINYDSMIENMIRNRMARAKLVGDSILKQGDINAETTRNLGAILSRGADAYQKDIEAKQYEDNYNTWLANKQAKQDELMKYLQSSNLSDDDKVNLYTYLMMYGGR